MGNKYYFQMEPIIGNSRHSQYGKAIELEGVSFDPRLPQTPKKIHIVLIDSGQYHQFILAGVSNQVFKEAILTAEDWEGFDGYRESAKLQQLAIFKMSTLNILYVQENRSDENYQAFIHVGLEFKKFEEIIPKVKINDDVKIPRGWWGAG